MPNNGPKHHLDVLGGLLPLTWRGIEVPCYSTGLDFAHRLTEHNQYGVSGGYQENGYRSSGTFTFKLLLRNGIEWPAYLYPGTFRDMLNALYDPSEGDLQHPEFGKLVCKVASVSVQWDPNKRDGADIDVTWKEHNAGLEEAELNLDMDIGGKLVDLAMSGRAIDADWEDDYGSNPLDVLNGLAGKMDMLQNDVNNKITQLEGAIASVNDIIDTLEKSTDPNAWGIANEAKKLLMDLGDLAANVLPDKRKRIILKVSDKRQPVSAAAGRWDMSTDEFLALNPRSAVSGYLEADEEFFVVEEVSA